MDNDQRLECWLSRQRSGSYMLTGEKPLLQPIGNSEQHDLYINPGDEIGFRHMCHWAVGRIWGVRLRRLESVRVWVSGGAIGEEDPT